MEISVRNLRERDCACDALILPCIEDGTALQERLSSSLPAPFEGKSFREFRGKKNELFFLACPGKTKPDRVLLAGLGKRGEISRDTVRQAGGKALTYVRNLGVKEIALSTSVLSSLNLSSLDFLEGGLLGLYAFERYRSEKEGKKVERIVILERPSKSLSAGIGRVTTVVSAVGFCKDLVTTPANDMTPAALAKAALSLRGKNLSVKVLEKKDAERLGMGTFLAVARGSHEPPKFIVLEYKGSKDAPVVLIGKSITFDSGGISLKPSDGMERMKYDMAGGAAVLGVMKAVSESKLPMHLVGILPATENLPGGSATKPGDVVRALNGKTVEIVNTDAEGRLALADAIAYAKRYRPRAIVDIATLTGACSIALGNEAAAMMGNTPGLIEEVRRASECTAERVWEMPLFEEYNEYLKSDIADLKNSGGRTGSLVTSACFLKEFAGDTPWVHLDIAGTAWAERDKPYIPKGASGIGVRLLLKFLEELN